MHSRYVSAGFRTHACAVGGLIILLLAIFCTDASAAGLRKAQFNPSNPPPFARKHKATGDDYFKDAVFIGDSSMDDVEMYDLFPTANFVTKIGISPLSTHRREFRYKGSREYETMFDVVAKYPHKKIYILLGANSLDNKSSDLSFADYKAMMEVFLERFPNSIFYLITPTAMTERVLDKLKISPKRFANFRDLLIKFARQRKCYIIDFYSLVLGDDGYLPAKYDCGDGVHPNINGLKLLEKEIRTHTVAPYATFTFAK